MEIDENRHAPLRSCRDCECRYVFEPRKDLRDKCPECEHTAATHLEMCWENGCDRVAMSAQVARIDMSAYCSHHHPRT